jgi:trehalose-phosphatase
VIDLLGRLARHPCIRVAVISGRRLSHVQMLLPVPGVLLAGTYGIELQMPNGERINRVACDQVRPTLERLKPQWEYLIAMREGFFLEDKAWALALHARYAESSEADEVLARARRAASEAVSSDVFRLLGGHRFLEVAPTLADKGRSIEYLLEQDPWLDALPVYVGDDDKDEEAFEAVKAHNGITMLVAASRRVTRADGWLESPQSTRQWLMTLVNTRPQDRPC